MNNLNKINSNSRAMRRGRSLSRSNSPYSKEDDSSAINDLRISAIENSKLKVSFKNYLKSIFWSYLVSVNLLKVTFGL